MFKVAFSFGILFQVNSTFSLIYSFFSFIFILFSTFTVTLFHFNNTKSKRQKMSSTASKTRISFRSSSLNLFFFYFFSSSLLFYIFFFRLLSIRFSETMRIISFENAIIYFCTRWTASMRTVEMSFRVVNNFS